MNTDWEGKDYGKYTISNKKRGEDGNKVISIRIKEDLLAELDRASSETNISRNELINIILRHGLDNLKIE